MNRSSRELAQNHIAIMNGAVGPSALTMRNAFSAWMTSHGVDLKTAQDRQLNDRLNVKMLHHLTTLLPSVLMHDSIDGDGDKRPRLFSDDENDIVAAQASTVFSAPAPDQYTDARYPHFYQPLAPYYVLGMNAEDKSLLLAAPSQRRVMTNEGYRSQSVPRPDSDRLYIAQPHDLKLGRLAETMNSDRLGLRTTGRGRDKRLLAVVKHLSVTRHIDALMDNPDARDGLFDRGIGRFAVHAASFGSFKLEHYLEPEPTKYLSDNALADFNVIDNLVRIATTFPQLDMAALPSLQVQPKISEVSDGGRPNNLSHNVLGVQPGRLRIFRRNN